MPASMQGSHQTGNQAEDLVVGTKDALTVFASPLALGR